MTAWNTEAARREGTKPDAVRVRELRLAVHALLAKRPDGRCICLRVVNPAHSLDEPENHAPGCVVGESLRP